MLGAAALLLAGSPAAAAGNDVPELGEALVLPAAGRGGRNPLPTDGLMHEMLHGAWRTPTEGATVRAADGGELTWRRLAAGPQGEYADRALQGGYALFNVNSAERRILLLEARGHSLVYINGEPRAGDPYSNGITRLPVLLRPGANELLFRVGRGRLSARLSSAPAEVYIGDWDATLPNLVEGGLIDAWCALPLVNATDAPLSELVIQATLPDGHVQRTPAGPVPASSVRKAAFQVRGVAAREPGELGVEVELFHGSTLLARTRVPLLVRRAGELHDRTFVSGIDGSVQYYSVLPARPTIRDDGPQRRGLVLSLHGASVEARGQAASYAPKTWTHVVAPTNRRPFGFDWEDWGRTDALEVLHDAQRAMAIDPRRIYLTGHSMGGHGAWHLGATFPDRFAAVGPSAGWISFWSYAGAARLADESPVGEIIERAAASSDTLAMLRNLATLGVYILHGDADDNVPVGQAREMAEKLRAFHTDLAVHEQAGAGHWWDDSDDSGVGCVDWTPMFDLFARRALPRRDEVRQVDFVTVNPAVSARCQWLRIEQQQRPLRPSRAALRVDPVRRTFSGTTGNVARMSLDLSVLAAGPPMRLDIDGTKLDEVLWPRGPDNARLWLLRADDGWRVAGPPAPPQKGPQRGGPFKQAFGNRFALVYGTRGAPQENAWMLARARYDAETFWYRGNGSVDVIADVDFDAARHADRNVILYGHADCNARWDLLREDCPVLVRRGRVRVGERELEGDDLACLWVYPRAGSDTGLIGVIGGSGLAGLRATEPLPLFLSGVAYPDWIVLRAAYLREGLPGVVGAGYFANDWSIDGECAWR